MTNLFGEAGDTWMAAGEICAAFLHKQRESELPSIEMPQTCRCENHELQFEDQLSKKTESTITDQRIPSDVLRKGGRSSRRIHAFIEYIGKMESI